MKHCRVLHKKEPGLLEAYSLKLPKTPVSFLLPGVQHGASHQGIASQTPSATSFQNCQALLQPQMGNSASRKDLSSPGQRARPNLSKPSFRKELSKTALIKPQSSSRHLPTPAAIEALADQRRPATRFSFCCRRHRRNCRPHSTVLRDSECTSSNTRTGDTV